MRQATGDESFPRQPRDKVHTVTIALTEPSPETISAVMSALGRRGGLKGGKARADALSARKRKAIAKKAAEARWGRSRTSKS